MPADKTRRNASVQAHDFEAVRFRAKNERFRTLTTVSHG